MSVLRDLPIRLRFTLIFVVGMSLMLAALGAFMYARLGSELLELTDASLAAQADALVSAVRTSEPAVGPGSGYAGSDEAFAQVLDPSGRVLESTALVTRRPLLPARDVRTVTHRTYVDRTIPGVDDVARLLIAPVRAPGGPVVLVVGTSLQDRKDVLVQFAAVLGIGGPIALALIAFAGWLLAGAMLRPVDRMRREADAISVSEPERRLSVPDGGDELARLGTTLNSMLGRLSESFERERRLLDDASHELRTPLALLKAELDLALLRDRTADELRTTVAKAAEETDRVVRLAEDLLVLSRAHRGRLEIHREETSIRRLLDEARDRHSARARAAGVRIEVAATGRPVPVDPLRLRQALDNVLDNALIHTPAGGVVDVKETNEDGLVRIVVEDSGSGFDREFLGRAFEPFSRDAGATGDDRGAGLGLAIVLAIARGHGGTATVENRPEGGARVTLLLRER